jgi:dipeptidyl aminopeptidase/acylaminoacyl peptidase
VYVFDRKTAKVRELKTGPGTIVDPKWSPDGKYVSYVRDYDVCAYDLAADKELAVTTGGTAVKTHGLAEFVAQEEMNRHTGYWWSPDSKSIAYEEADHAGVETWYVADPFKPDVKPQDQFYPRPGHKNVSVRLGIKPVIGGETVWAEWDRTKYEYLAAVRWDKHGPLTVQLQDRKQQVLSLCRVDPTDGRVKGLIEDRGESWVNLNQDVPKWYDADRFLWLSERDGDARLYIVDARARGSERIKAVSPPGLQVTGLVERLLHCRRWKLHGSRELMAQGGPVPGAPGRVQVRRVATEVPAVLCRLLPARPQAHPPPGLHRAHRPRGAAGRR